MKTKNKHYKIQFIAIQIKLIISTNNKKFNK